MVHSRQCGLPERPKGGLVTVVMSGLHMTGKGCALFILISVTKEACSAILVSADAACAGDLGSHPC